MTNGHQMPQNRELREQREVRDDARAGLRKRQECGHDDEEGVEGDDHPLQRENGPAVTPQRVADSRERAAGR
jgi:hypothetical protein